MSKVPDMHRQLLEKQVAELRPNDLEHVLWRYEHKRSTLRPMGVGMIDAMLRELEHLYELLKQPGDLTERERDVAVAAMKYFLREDDHVNDDHPVTGLVDDALVVTAAMEELRARLEGQ